MTQYTIVDRNDEWVLPIAGFDVARISFEPGNIRLLFYDKGHNEYAEIQIGRFVLYSSRASDGIAIDPDDAPQRLLPVLELRNARLLNATFSRSGDLTLSFDGGRVIAAGPEPDFESWEVNGPGGVFAVSPLGGGEPSFRDDTDSSFTLGSQH